MYKTDFWEGEGVVDWHIYKRLNSDIHHVQSSIAQKVGTSSQSWIHINPGS